MEIAELTLEGVAQVSRDRVRQVIETRPGPWWPWADARYYDVDVLAGDVERIEALYRDLGYPFARVVSHGAVVNRPEGEARVVITIEEGMPVVVTDTALSGLDRWAPAEVAELRERLPLQPGEPAAIAEAAASAELIAGALNDRGHPYATVRVREERTSVTDMRLTFDADPGPVAWFDEIEIIGNVGVDDDTIRRQLLYRPGDRFERRLLQQSHKRLQQLGLFRFVNIEPIDTEQQPGALDTRVTVVEGDHHQIEGSVGYGTEEQLRGNFKWRNVNFFGGARTFAAGTSWSWLRRSAEFDFLQPYFFRPGLALALNGHYLKDDEAAYDLTARGGSAGLIGSLTPNTTWRVTALSTDQVSQIGDEVLADPSLRDDLIALGLDPETGRQGGWLNSITVGADRVTADDPLNPQRGYGVSAQLEYAGDVLPGDFDFFEWDFAGRHYQPFGERLMLASRLRVATIDPAGTSAALPFAQRYFLGGSTSLRGWGRYEVSPLSANGLPLGGKSLVDSSVELRARVNGNLGAVAFVDAGNVWWNEWQFDLEDVLADAGAGVRYFTPVGPLRLDLAWQLTPTPNLFVEGQHQSRRWRIHFSIGQAF